ncbi:MAG TPA: hypothetical protein VJT72_23590 [Pseudonocardiaceae bacterium]|nr:hypothetical protein [Pseudonocardiaceae bacterium]
MPTDAFHHLVINLDVQDSGQRTDPSQLSLRNTVYDIVQSAFAATGIDSQHQEDRGDGVLLVLPAAVPKKQMLGRWVNELHEALKERNAPLKEPIKVRVGIHAGELHHDDHGVAGNDVNIACRLASCEPAKGTLHAVTRGSMVVAVSDIIYQSVVRHGGPFIDPDSYRRYPLRTSEFDGFMWLYVPGHSVPPRPTPAPQPPPTPAQTSLPGAGSVTIGRDGTVVSHSKVRDIVIGGSDHTRRAP